MTPAAGPGPAVAVALAAGALALLAPGAAAGGIGADPTPIPADGTATVTAAFPAPVEEADLRACQADGDRSIRSCYPPTRMTQESGGNWTATVPPSGAFGEAAYAGLNATGRTADGRDIHLPGNATYRFVAVASADPGVGTPGPGPAAVLACLAGAALARRSPGQG